MSKVNDLKAQRERLEQKQRQLTARIRQAESREREGARKARTHALIVLGGLFESACGGDWTQINFDDVRNFLDRNHGMFERYATWEKLETNDAAKRLRGWERKQRKAASEPESSDADNARSDGVQDTSFQSVNESDHLFEL